MAARRKPASCLPVWGFRSHAGATAIWPYRSVNPAWWPPSEVPPSGAGSMRMPSGPGSIAAGCFPAIRTYSPRPAACWISTKVFGKVSPCVRMSSSCAPMRKPPSRPASVATPLCLPGPTRPSRSSMSTVASDPGPIWPPGMFTEPRSMAVANPAAPLSPSTAWSNKS